MSDLPPFMTGMLVVLLMSAFVRFATVLTIFRYGIGLTGWTFGIITGGVSLALAFTVLSAQLPASKLDIFHPEVSSNVDLEKTYRPFLEKHTDPKILSEVIEAQVRIAHSTSPDKNIPPQFPALLSAFLLSELKAAFQIGLLILIPFVVIDLLTANILAVLGVTQLSAYTVSLPLKILLFFAVDGWTLLSQKLLMSYGG